MKYINNISTMFIFTFYTYEYDVIFFIYRRAGTGRGRERFIANGGEPAPIENYNKRIKINNYLYMVNILLIFLSHNGHFFNIPIHFSQNCVCPHGTSALFFSAKPKHTQH